MVFLIDPKFVPCTFEVMAVTGHAKILDERTALQGKIGVPRSELTGIHYSRRFLVYERNVTAVEKLANLTLCAGSIRRPSARLVIAFAH